MVCVLYAQIVVDGGLLGKLALEYGGYLAEVGEHIWCGSVVGEEVLLVVATDVEVETV